MTHATMRDGSIDYETGWISNGHWERRAPDLSRGFAGLGADGEAAIANISKVGRRYIFDALRDPQAKPIVIDLLRSSNPEAVLTRQAEQDVAESLHPTGKTIVFKSLVAKVAPKLSRAQASVVAAADPRTEQGRVVQYILANSPAPQADVEEYLTMTALDALAPGEVPQGEEDWMSGLGAFGNLGMSKKWRRIAKYTAITAGVIVGGAILAGVILPAVGPALASAGSAVVGAVGSVFKPKPKPPTGTTGEPVSTGIDQGYVNGKLQAICNLKQSAAFDVSAASQADAETAALASYIARGANISVAQATAQIQQATASCGAAGGQAQPIQQAPAAAAGPDLSSIAGAALAIYQLKMTGNTQQAAAQQQAAVQTLQSQGLSASQAQALVNQAVNEVASRYDSGQPAPSAEPTLTPFPGVQPTTPRPIQAGMGIETGDLIKYGLIAAAGIAVVSQMGKGGGRGGSRRSRRR